jgi:hypothetical protein
VQRLVENIIKQGLAARILSDRQIGRIIDGSGSASRYGLVNRALKAGELVRIRRGLYTLAPCYRPEPAHPFVIAQALVANSYVSFETALSFHGWIPEAVHVTASVVPGRKSSELEHPLFGSFTFHPLALDRDYFLELIERRQFGQQAALVAKPLRALTDLVAFRKLSWQGLDWLVDGMRIDADRLRTVTRKEIDILSDVYKQKRPNEFLAALAKELGRD